jgi:hypothetical protein
MRALRKHFAELWLSYASVYSNPDSNVPIVLHGLLPTSEVHEAKSSLHQFYGTRHSEWYGRRRIVPACRDRSSAWAK